MQAKFKRREICSLMEVSCCDSAIDGIMPSSDAMFIHHLVKQKNPHSKLSLPYMWSSSIQVN